MTDHDVEESVSDVNSTVVRSIYCDLMLEEELMSFEADSDGEDPPEIISNDDQKTNDNVYMPQCEEGYLVQIDDNWQNTALENEFCRKVA